MADMNVKTVCPTCGQSMKFVKSKKDIGDNGKPYVRWQIWNCLNCNEEWEVDILKNMLELKIE